MLKSMGKGLILFLALTLLTGIAYPLAVTGLAQLIFPRQADGSLVYQNGQAVGSKLIGQNFSGPEYFQGRPSAAGPNGYDATASGGSNLGPTNPRLLSLIAQRVKTVRQENNLPAGTPIPGDLVMASASGLDPDISPEAALLQVARVAAARNLPEQEVRALVEKQIQSRELGVLGEPRVNVLQLNLALESR